MDLQDRVMESVFREYFEEEKSLGGRFVLKEFSEHLCMGASLVMGDRNDAGRREVKEEMEDF